MMGKNRKPKDAGHMWAFAAFVWSRKEEVWCYSEGATFVKTMDVGEAAGPFTRLRGRGNRGFIVG